jgi:hypothetical protein
VAVRHDEVIVADDGFAFGGGTAMNGHELTEHAVVADDGPGLFAFELQILGHTPYYGVREDMAVIAKDHIVIYIGEGVNGDILADLSFRAHIC